MERLREIYFELIAQGANNINLVTPTHFTHAVLESLKEPLPVPVVYNTSGFETLDTLRKLKRQSTNMAARFKIQRTTLPP